MPAHSDRVGFRGRLATRAAVVPATWNDDARTVEITWTTGARGLRTPWFGEPYWEELAVTPEAVDLARLNNGAPFLNAHNGYDLNAVIGVVERAWLAGNEGRATVRFSDRPEVQPIAADVKSGILRHISVGYDVAKYKDVGEHEGKRILRAVQWAPMEVSLVSMGFDDSAVVRTRGADSDPPVYVPIERGSLPPQENTPMAAEPQGGTPAIATPSAPPAAPAAAPAAPAGPVAGEGTRSAEPVQGASSASVSAEQIRAAADAAVKADRERSADIVRRATAVGLADFGRQLADSGCSVADAKDRILEKLAEGQRNLPNPIPSGAGVTVTDDNSDRWQRGAQDRIFERSGLVDLMKRHAEKRGETYKADAAEFRSMKLFDLARDSLIRSGMSYRDVSRLGDRDLVSKAFTRAAGGQSTGEFSTLLENTMHTVLQASYDLYPADWPRFCKTISVSDFRAHPFYRRGSLGSLQKVNPGGEIENLKLADGRKESLTAYTYAGIVALDREVIINDDLSVFSDLGSQAGEAAAYTIEQLVFDSLALNSNLGPTMSDGLPLFDSTRTVVDSSGTSRDLSNIYPTGTTIGVSALEANAVQMAQMRDVSGNRVLNVKPQVMLLPIGLLGTANVINGSQFDVDPVTANATNMFQKPNRVQGMFKDIVGSPLISGTRRYLFADPNRYPTMAVAFLNGQSSPLIESRDGWRTMGTEWRITLDAGVGAVDFRSALTDDGTP